jgi:head-tail adaptor
MQSGQYRERITIQKQSTTRDELGQLLDTWTNVLGPIPASVAINRAGEGLSSNQVIANADLVVTIRRKSQSGLDETMRLLWHTADGTRTEPRTLHIVGFGLDPKRRELMLWCRS